MKQILHITQRTFWEKSVQTGFFQADSLHTEGYIHCSTKDQVLRVANKFFSGIPDLLLLKIELENLTSEVRWEPGDDDDSELFPHIYGRINLEAVVGIIQLELDADGNFIVPMMD